MNDDKLEEISDHLGEIKKVYWVCEFCFKTIDKPIDLPKDWIIVFQSCICPDCRKKLEMIPDWIQNVPGGSFASGTDPRKKK